MVGTYVLNEGCAFRCGVSSISLCKGAVVIVRQVDVEGRKILIDFGGRDVDWIDDGVMSKLDSKEF